MPATAAWRRYGVLIPLLLAAALALSMIAATPADAQTRRERKISHGVHVALNQKGDPYRYGAAGPSAFDCSGLLMFSYAKAGISLPRTSDGQASHVRRIHKKRIRRGDLVFFHNSGGVYHVAMYLGRRHGQRFVLHASTPGTNVKRDPIWTRSWFAGTLRHRK